MRLSPPTKAVFFLSALLALLSPAGQFAGLPIVSSSAYPLIPAACLLLYLVSVFRGIETTPPIGPLRPLYQRPVAQQKPRPNPACRQKPDLARME